jgi:hypothetical protein
MGDRCNIVVRDKKMDPSMPLEEVLKEGSVVFYGHWSGEAMPFHLRSALGKHWRWGDAPYLARIIFDEFTQNSHREETGFGISTGLCDNEHPVMVVDVPDQKVHMYSLEGPATCSWSFSEYVAIPDAKLELAYDPV